MPVPEIVVEPPAALAAAAGESASSSLSLQAEQPQPRQTVKQACLAFLFDDHAPLSPARPLTCMRRLFWAFHVVVVMAYLGYLVAVLSLQYADYHYFTLWTWTLQLGFYTLTLVGHSSFPLLRHAVLLVALSWVHGAVWAVMAVSTAMNALNPRSLWFPGVSFLAILNDLWMHYAPLGIMALYVYFEKDEIRVLLRPRFAFAQSRRQQRLLQAALVALQCLLPVLWISAWSLVFRPVDVYPTELTNAEFWGIGVAGIVVAEAGLWSFVLLGQRASAHEATQTHTQSPLHRACVEGIAPPRTPSANEALEHSDSRRAMLGEAVYVQPEDERPQSAKFDAARVPLEWMRSRFFSA